MNCWIHPRPYGHWTLTPSHCVHVGNSLLRGARWVPSGWNYWQVRYQCLMVHKGKYIVSSISKQNGLLWHCCLPPVLNILFQWDILTIYTGKVMRKIVSTHNILNVSVLLSFFYRYLHHLNCVNTTGSYRLFPYPLQFHLPPWTNRDHHIQINVPRDPVPWG